MIEDEEELLPLPILPFLLIPMPLASSDQARETNGSQSLWVDRQETIDSGENERMKGGNECPPWKDQEGKCPTLDIFES